tara:strand:+ start:11602 stop:12072 length:471 start_codon:yes stop_codon:yes gene_type:complete
MAEQIPVWIAVELAFHHYEAEELKASTLFMNVHFPGTDKEQVDVFPLGSTSVDLFERGVMIPESFGYPVHPYILDDDGRQIAGPTEIGYFDHPRHEDEYQKFTYKEMNIIMKDFDGLCEILVDEEELNNNFIQPIYVDDLVVLRGLSPDEDDGEAE